MENQIKKLYYFRETRYFVRKLKILTNSHCVKSVQIRNFFWSVFSAFGLNTERHEVFLHIQSECGKIRTRNNSVFGHILTSSNYSTILHKFPTYQCLQKDIRNFFVLLISWIIYQNKRKTWFLETHRNQVYQKPKI